jgi:hypothetical protein
MFKFSSVPATNAATQLRADDVLWVLASLCSLHQKPFEAQLINREFLNTESVEGNPTANCIATAPESTLIQAAEQLGLWCVH